MSKVTPCPVCGKTDQLIALRCALGSRYERDIFCSRCQCKITESKWDTRYLTPKQQHSDEMYEMLNDLRHTVSLAGINSADNDAILTAIDKLLAKARGETK